MFYIIKDKKIKCMSSNKIALERILENDEKVLELDLGGAPTDLVTVEENGTFTVTAVEPSPTDIKKNKMAEIKRKYEEKFKAYESALMRARLAGNDTAVTELQAMYKSDMVAMTAEIKGV